MRVISSIRQWINQGELAQGDRLPAEMQLARKFDVSRDTVRAALKDLEDQGLLTSSRNRTRQVAARQPQASTGSSLMSKSIAVLASFGELDKRYPDTNMAVVLQEAVEQIASAGWHAIHLQSQQVAQDDFVCQLLADPPAGLLIAEKVIGNDKARVMVQRLLEAGVPIVINDEEPDIKGCDQVIFDHYAGSYELTTYLVKQGAKNIAPLFFCEQDHLWVARRFAGYEAAVKKAGLQPLPVTWIDSRWDQSLNCSQDQRFEMQTRLFVGYLVSLLKADCVPDAIITINDGHTYPIAAACRLLGVEPNVDIKIAGYDNSWMHSFENELEPSRPVATIDKNNPEAGREMVQLLIDRIEHRLTSKPQIRKIKPYLVIPDSENI